MAGSFTSQAYPATSTLQRVVDNLNVALTVDLTDSATLDSEVSDAIVSPYPPLPN